MPSADVAAWLLAGLYALPDAIRPRACAFVVYDVPFTIYAKADAASSASCFRGWDLRMITPSHSSMQTLACSLRVVRTTSSSRLFTSMIRAAFAIAPTPPHCLLSFIRTSCRHGSRKTTTCCMTSSINIPYDVPAEGAIRLHQSSCIKRLASKFLPDGVPRLPAQTSDSKHSRSTQHCA